ncbi:MAG: ECF transporter S component [Clostridia bacterium]|nr:ECF transporter S component [Clostridia bacterium]
MSLRNTERTRRLVMIAIISAIIIVLQVISNYIKFGPVQITLALTPIIIGAALYGMVAGAVLGAVLGVVILIWGLLGLDGGFVLLLIDTNPFFAVTLCILKTTIAGFVSGAVFKALSKKNDVVASFVAGGLCPIVNTGVFLAGMFAVFGDTLRGFAEAAGAQSVFVYVITALVGINFLVELIVNMVLATAVTRIIRATS